MLGQGWLEYVGPGGGAPGVGIGITAAGQSVQSPAVGRNRAE